MLVVVDVGARAPFYNALYPVRASAHRIESHIPPGAVVGFTESNRATALAVHLDRPLRQLSPAVIAGPPPAPAPAFVLLPEVEFRGARQAWALAPVDEVVFHNVHYVLAAVGDDRE